MTPVEFIISALVSGAALGLVAALTRLSKGGG